MPDDGGYPDPDPGHAAAASAQDDASVPEQRRIVAWCAEVADLPRYLPPYLAERRENDGARRRERILQALSCDGGLPSGSEVSFAMRNLKSYLELRCPHDVDFRVTVILLLWRLFAATVDLSPPVYSYALQSRVVDSLKLWLLRFAEEAMVPVGYDEAMAPDVAAALDRLKSELDVRLPLRVMLQEMGGSFRTDKGVACGRRRSFTSGLMALCVAMHRFHPVSVGPWLDQHVACRLDGAHIYVMLYARLLVALTPLACIPRLVVDGRLWSWWTTIPEGLVPKFDLMWFGLLGRLAEHRWSGGIAVAPQDECNSATLVTEAECDEALSARMPWLMNKVCRTMALPFCSPAAISMESKPAAPVDLDRYQVPHELDEVVGQPSSWKDVARFLVYSLEADPPPAATQATGSAAVADADNIWSILMLILHRMRPFLKPVIAKGEWLWHCSTFNHSLVSAYFDRVCRERLVPCTAAQSRRLTRASDVRFLELVLPLVSDAAQMKGAYEQVAAFDSLRRLSRMSVMQLPGSAWDSLCSGSFDPFMTSLPSLIYRAAESLRDPSEADRHVTLLQQCACTLQALAYRWPSALNSLLPVVLWGIDASDVQKTVASFGLLVTLFCDVPCIDSNDWPSGSGAGAAATGAVQAAGAWNWPWPAGARSQDEAGESGGASIVVSMMPAFAADFVERICEFVTHIPKPAKGNPCHASTTSHLEYASLSLMGGALCLLAAQCDPATYKGMLNTIGRFVNSTLLLDQAKPMKIMVASAARVDPGVSLPIFLPPLFRKLLPRRFKVGDAVLPLHELDASESEAKWCLEALTAIVRYAGDALLAYRAELEAVVKGSLMDERAGVPKLGAKLLRRLLFSTTATYVLCDYRLVSVPEWKRLIAGRGGQGYASDAWPLKWWGQSPPWWAMYCPSSPSDPGDQSDSGSLAKAIDVAWHVPSSEEMSWAQALVSGALQCIAHMLTAAGIKAATAEGVGLPPVADVEGVEWMQGLKLPAKKRAGYGACLAMKVAYAVQRGTEELWPDERTDQELEDNLLPRAAPSAAGSTAYSHAVLTWLADVLHATMLELSQEEKLNPGDGGVANSQPAATSATTRAHALEPSEVPRILGKVIASVGEITGALREGHPEGATLFQSSVRKRGHDVVGSISLMQRSTVLDGIHVNSKWRDFPRVWWILRVADTLEAHRTERNGCHRYAGRRKRLLDTLCWLSFAGHYELVRARAQEVLSCAAKLHTGCRWPLLRDVALPALAAETEATLRCHSLAGKAASREHTRLNDALVGLASVFGGGLPGFVSTAWRRGVDDASRVGVGLCEMIYATTRAVGRPPPEAPSPPPTGTSTSAAAGGNATCPPGSEGGNGSKEQRCEIEFETVALVIAAGKYWLEHREGLCRDPPRRAGMDAKGSACGDEDGEDDDEGAGGGEQGEDGGTEPDGCGARADAAPKGAAALEAVVKLLDICERPDCHWRAQAMATASSLAIRNALGYMHADPELTELGRPVWRRWAMWLVRCCDPRKPCGLHSLATHGLSLLMRQHAPLSDAELVAAPPHGPGLCDAAFFEKLLVILPAVHHSTLMSGGAKGDDNEVTRDAVLHITEQRWFRLWPRVWLKRSSRHFSMKGALFWQTYVAFLIRSPKVSQGEGLDSGHDAEVAEERLAALLQRATDFFTEQPMAEAEYHVAFCDLVAGTLRALRRDRHAPLRRRAWSLLHNAVAMEVHKGSQDRLDEWCDAMRFAVSGSSRPLLRGGAAAGASGAQPADDEDSTSYLTPLLNFVAGPEDREPAHDTLTFGWATIRHESSELKAAADEEGVGAEPGASSSASPAPKEASSFGTFKRLRLLMSLLKEPRAIAHIRLHPTFAAEAWEALRPGLGHPYKQLREEVARAFFSLLRSSALPTWPPWQHSHPVVGATGGAASGGNGGGDLAVVAGRLEQWLGEEAERLQGLLRADSTSQARQGGDPTATRAPHVIESSGLCYAVFYLALSRRTSFHLAEALPRCLAFLLAASTHGDLELRALGPQALALICSAHPLPLASAPADFPSVEQHAAAATALRALLNGSVEQALPEKECEKALGAVRHVVTANFMLLSCRRSGSCSSDGTGLAALRAVAEALAGHQRSEVRIAARGALASFLSLDRRADMLASLARYRASAGPAPTAKRAGPGISRGDAPSQALAGVVGMCCALLAASDCGVPSWTGRVVEVLAPYGRQGVGDVALKEVQDTIQTFLKMQQSNLRSWKECQDRLSPTQLDLLTESKGKLSYFS